jgi:type I restriction-modification system DNA methylase subunit
MRQRQRRQLGNASARSKEFVELLESFRSGVSNYQLFQDFSEMATLSISNAIPFGIQDVRERRERQYLSTASKYKKNELEIFAHMLGVVTMAFDEDPDQDFLGRIFMLAELGNDNLGQFFTPYTVSKLVAEMNFAPKIKEADFKEKEFISICDPCVGAGGLLIAAFNAAKDSEINPQTQILFHGADLSPQAAHMAYIQCSLLGLSAVISIGNSLTLERSEVFYTPMYCLNWWRFVQDKGSERSGHGAKVLMDSF